VGQVFNLPRGSLGRTNLRPGASEKHRLIWVPRFYALGTELGCVLTKYIVWRRQILERQS